MVLCGTPRARSLTIWDLFRSPLIQTMGDYVMVIPECMKKASRSIGIAVGMPDPDLKLCDLMAGQRTLSKMPVHRLSNKGRHEPTRAIYGCHAANDEALNVI